MRNKALEAWAWVLIYGGLLLVMLGIYLGAAGGAGVFKLLGGITSAVGALMIVIRSRRPPDGD